MSDALKAISPSASQGARPERVLSAAEQAKVQDAAQQFESLLLHQLMTAMSETVPKEGLLSGSREEQYFKDMLHQALAESISKGSGIGVADVLEKEMREAEEKSK